MAKSNRTIIQVDIPSDFTEKFDETIEDEFNISQSKWGVKLSEEEKKKIRNVSIEQVMERLKSVNNSSWEYGDLIAVVNVNGRIDDNIDNIFFPLTEEQEKKFSIYTNNMNPGKNFAISIDDGDNHVPLTSFNSAFIQQLLTWVRTAVFYGVGSLRDF